MNAVANFVSYRLRFATSILTSAVYLIYISSGTVPTNSASVATDPENARSLAHACRAVTVNDILRIVNGYISNNTRSYIVTYSTSFGTT